MARSGFWFQWARGRAIVRTHAMREARHLKRLITAHGVTHSLDVQLRYQVQRARQANRDWRTYRQHHIEFERDQ